MSEYSFQMQIGQILQSGLASSPNQEIFHADIKRYAYTELYERVCRAAGVFQSLGMGEGKTIAVMDWDSHRYFECYFSVPMIGATLHTINIRLSPEQILYTINHAQDDLILCHEDFLPILTQFADRITNPFKLIVLQDSPSDVSTEIESIGEYESLLSASEPVTVFPDLDENTRATIFYTTGTTGDPKGVSYSHRQIVLHTLCVVAGLGTVPGAGISRDDVYMPITPLFHVHAWGFPYVATLLGIKQVYSGQYEPSKLLSLIEKHRVTFSHCVPTILNGLLTHPDSQKFDLSGLKLIIGGSAFPKGLAKAALNRGIDANTGYGLSETCPLLTTSDLMKTRSDDDINLRTATGVPAPFVQIRVVNEDMEDVPIGGSETGEVVTRSPWLTHGYMKNPETTSELWRGGWLHTGDVGYLDNTGTLHITDRIKDVIKSGGEWISSLVLESLASSVNGVIEAAAIGVPDAKWGERPLMLVVAEGDIQEVEKQIREQFAKEARSGRISKWAEPEIIRFLDQLPKTSVGKLDKKVMRAKHSGNPT